jgi:hypothetical protein
MPEAALCFDALATILQIPPAKPQPFEPAPVLRISTPGS